MAALGALFLVEGLKFGECNVKLSLDMANIGAGKRFWIEPPRRCM